MNNVVGWSAWLAYFANDQSADFFATAIEQTSELIVPTLSLYEVFKRILQQRGEGAALQVVALMRQGRIVELSSSIALTAARISHESKLPMVDSVILATVREHDAILWTQDADFE